MLLALLIPKDANQIQTFLCIATSVADVAGVNTNGHKVYLANAFSLFPN